MRSLVVVKEIGSAGAGSETFQYSASMAVSVAYHPPTIHVILCTYLNEA